MNCLQYALRFWEINNKYKIYYNGDHAVNSDEKIEGNNYALLSKYTLNDVLAEFKDLTPEDIEILKRYFTNENT